MQEEHENQGGWNFVRPRARAVLHRLAEEGVIKNPQLEFVGRSASCSSAAGTILWINKKLIRNIWIKKEKNNSKIFKETARLQQNLNINFKNI